MEMIQTIAVNALYLLALINPISKIAVLSGLASTERRSHLRALVYKSSITAAGILLGAMFFGDFILQKIFHVELYALRFSGGAVLFWVGFNALRKGVFFEQDDHAPAHFIDLAIVPLACPMIAGPATIAAAITLAAHTGLPGATAAVLPAILVNLALMLYSLPIAAVLKKIDILGALIRITGLIVMTIGAQMVFDGLAQWKSLPALP